jgi:hypothetical protein
MVHVGRERLLEIEENNLRLAGWEVDHMESCKECLDTYARAALIADEVVVGVEWRRSNPSALGETLCWMAIVQQRKGIG